MPHWDDDSDPDLSNDYPDQWEDDDETAPQECPKCGADCYEDAEQCPHCGEWLMWPSTAWQNRPWWWIALGVLGIYAVLRVFIPL